MTEQEAFLATINANPDDMTTRLVYADWLQDRGHDDDAVRIRTECKILLGATAGEMGEWFVDRDDHARAEFVEVSMERNAMLGDGTRCYPCGWPIATDGRGCRPNGDCSFRPSERDPEHDRWHARMLEVHALTARRAAILAANPGWLRVECPECGGNPPEFPTQGGNGTFRACQTCLHTGDLMRTPGPEHGVHIYNLASDFILRPYTFHCDNCVPFIRSVTLPTLDAVGRMGVREIAVSGVAIQCEHGYDVCPQCDAEFHPTPLARALRDAIPTLLGIGVAELRPSEHYRTWGWYRDGSLSEPDELPIWLWDKVSLPETSQYWKTSPTEDAANWALESALYTMVKGSNA